MKKCILSLAALAICISTAAAETCTLDQSRLFNFGDGDSQTFVLLHFGKYDRLDNLVFGYKYNGELPEANTILKDIAETHPHMEWDESENIINFDLNGDYEYTSTLDHSATYTGNETFGSLNSEIEGYIINLSDEENYSGPEDYIFYIPDPEAEGIYIPDTLTLPLSDTNPVLGSYVQIPEGMTWSSITMYRRDSTTSTKTDNTKFSNMTRISGTGNYNAQLKFTGNATGCGTTYLQMVFNGRQDGATKKLTSNFCEATVNEPLIPVESITINPSEVEAKLSHVIEYEVEITPADATYTGLVYNSSDTKIATASSGVIKTTTNEGSAIITVSWNHNPEISDQMTINSAMREPVEDITFEGVGEDGYITLNPKQMTGLRPIFTPEDPDIQTVSITLSNNGTSKDDYIATMYPVNIWDSNNNRSNFYELSAHRAGECLITVKNTIGATVLYEKEIPVRVVERDRSIELDYTTGFLFLNEEWYGHTNGGLNWYSPDYEITYQAYERENPGMGFGCTSQFGVIYDNKLIVSSKQADDAGDCLRGGGRLVVADAATLKRLGSIDNIIYGDESTSGDGRGVCGAGPGRAYLATHKGIYIIDTDNYCVLGKVAGIAGSDKDGDNNNTSTGGDLYNSQVGDILLAGDVAFAVTQTDGLYAIDIHTDKVLKQIGTATDEKYSVQGITQDCNGYIWYSENVGVSSNFVQLDPSTLEEMQRVVVPAEYGQINCGWGAWRSTQFTASKELPWIFFAGGSSVTNGGAGKYYKYDIKYQQFTFLLDITVFPGALSANQGAYGTIRYDDRTNELIVGTTEFNASGHYRWNWTHFVNPDTSEVNHTVELEPYYWFQAVPIFPDAYAPELESIDDVVLDINDEPQTITLNATDTDNIDANIRISLINSPETADDENIYPVEVALEGNKLTITPKAIGEHTVGLSVESNGRISQYAVNVSVTEKTEVGVDSFETPAISIYSENADIIVNNCNGATFNIVNTTGSTVASFSVDSDNYVYHSSLAHGIYIIMGDNGISKKLIIK